MAQIQVLPAVPTFGQGLVGALAQAGSDVGQGLMRRNAQTALQQILNPQPAQGANPASPMAGMPQGQAAAPGLSPAKAVQLYSLAEQAYGKEGAKQFANAYVEQQKSGEKEAQQIRKEQRQEKREGIKERVKESTGSLATINSQRRNLLSARAAVESGDVGAFSQNSFADLFGEAGKRFKTASGAQLDAATKNLLIDSLGDVTARGTNLWLEKVAKSAAPELGKSEEANETLITIALGNLDIKQKKIDTEQELLNQYDQLGVKPPPNFDKVVDDIVQPYSKMIEQQVSYDTRVLYEKEKGEKFLKNLEEVPKGTPLTLEKRDALFKKFTKVDLENATPEQRLEGEKKVVAIAKKLGYTIPDRNIIERKPQAQEPIEQPPQGLNEQPSL